MCCRITPMKKILVIGSACADVGLYVDHLPSSEEDVQPRKQKISLGGCACNVAGILQLFEVPFTLFAPVGTGIYGTFVESEFRKKGLIPVIRSEEENGACYCIVDDSGSRTFIAVHGAEYLFRKEWFDALDVEQYDAVYVCGLELEEKTGNVILDFLEKHQEMTIYFAPGPRIQFVPEERMNRILSMHPVVHCNRREAAVYAGHTEYSSAEAAYAIYAKTENTVIITDGGNPCIYVHGNVLHAVPAFSAEPVDGTGAGDSHIGTVMAMVSLGYYMDNAVMMANRIGAKVTETEGTCLDEQVFRKTVSEVKI